MKIKIIRKYSWSFSVSADFSLKRRCLHNQLRPICQFYCYIETIRRELNCEAEETCSVSLLRKEELEFLILH
jgi:hypothetical protein